MCSRSISSPLRNRLDPRLLRSGRHREDPTLFLGRRILDDHVEHEAIELRLRQRIGAFLLDRILRGQHEQRTVEVVANAADGDLVFLHRLEQRGLRLGRRPVDLVGQQNVREDRPADEADDPLARRSILLDHLGAQDVGRHQVGRELNAVELQMDGFRQLLDDQRLREARHAAQQAVPAGEKGDQDFAQDAALADNRLPELALEPQPPSRRRRRSRPGASGVERPATCMVRSAIWIAVYYGDFRTWRSRRRTSCPASA